MHEENPAEQLFEQRVNGAFALRHLGDDHRVRGPRRCRALLGASLRRSALRERPGAEKATSERASSAKPACGMTRGRAIGCCETPAPAARQLRCLLRFGRDRTSCPAASQRYARDLRASRPHPPPGTCQPSNGPFHQSQGLLTRGRVLHPSLQAADCVGNVGSTDPHILEVPVIQRKKFPLSSTHTAPVSDLRCRATEDQNQDGATCGRSL